MTDDRFEYDYTTNVLTTYDENAHRRTERYDMAGRVSEATQYNGAEAIRRAAYFDGAGNPVAIIGPRAGEEVYSSYNSLNLMERQVGSQETFFENGSEKTTRSESLSSYDKAGRLVRTTVIGPANKETVGLNILDGLGRAIETRVVDPATDEVLAVSKKYYDPNGNVVKELDPNNTILPEGERKYTVAEYSARDKVLSTADLEGRVTTYAYNADDTVSRLTGPRGNSGKYPKENFTLSYTYDDQKRLVTADLPPKEPGGERPKIQFVYDKRGNLLKRINPDKGETTYTYTARNKVLTETVTDKAIGKSEVTAYEYDKAGNLWKTTDARGKVTEKVYDDLNRLKKVILPDGSTSEYEYDAAGNRTTVIDGLGHRTENAYNLYNKLIVTRTAGLAPTDDPYRYSYDRLGNLTRTVDMLGNTRHYSYDQLNRLVSERDEEGGLYQYEYDNMTNVTESTDPNGTTAAYEYTPTYKLKKLELVNAIKSQSKTISYDYDEEGFITCVNDDGVVSSYNNYDPASGTGYEPDAYGRIKKEVTTIDGKSFAVGDQYDLMDRLTGITYPNNKSVTYQYNALGEVTGMPGYVQGAPEYEHGLVTSLTAANGVRTDYTYDDNARLTGLKYSGESGNLKEYLLTYDKAGNIIQKNQDMFKYDEENRLVEAYLTGSFSVDAEKEQQPVGAVQEDVLGDRQLDFNLEEAVEDPTLLSLDYNAGSFGVDLGDTYELSRIELRPLSAENRVMPKHIRVFVSDDNNPRSYVEKKAFTAAYKNKGEATILEIAFTEKVKGRYVKVKTDFNERDLATFQAINVAQFKNSPDKLIRVYYRVPNRTEKYTYDLMGNRKTETVTMKKTEVKNHGYYADGSRLKTNGKWAYVYDPNGNTVAKGDTLMIEGVAIKVKDAQAYLATITDSTTQLPFTTENGGVYWHYEWDLLNRLVKVRKNGVDVAAYIYSWKGYRVKKEKLNAKPDEVRTTYYVFSPQRKVLYEEQEKTAGEDANFYRQYDYLFNKLFAKDVGRVGSTVSDARFYYHTDHLGSVVAATNESGTVIWSNEFTPFGSAADSANKPDGGFKFASYEYDEDVQLNYALARWQDPETGRFTSLDPARDGVNWYVYAANNPLRFIDPLGLDYSSYGEAFGYSYSNYESGRLAGGEAAGGGPGGGPGEGSNSGRNAFYDDSITQMEAEWDSELAKAMGKAGYIKTSEAHWVHISSILNYAALMSGGTNRNLIIIDIPGRMLRMDRGLEKRQLNYFTKQITTKDAFLALIGNLSKEDIKNTDIIFFSGHGDTDLASMGPENDDPDQTITADDVKLFFASLGEPGLDKSNRLFFAMCDQGKDFQRSAWADAFGLEESNVFGHTQKSLEPIDFQFVLSVIEGKPILDAWNEAVNQVQEANTIFNSYLNQILVNNPTFYINNPGTARPEAADFASREIMRRYNIDY